MNTSTLLQNNNFKPVILFLMGPTAIGKTALALKLAEKFPVEIINVDSALIYKGMNIGTGKPTSQELQKVKHHLVDFLEPNEQYSVNQFCHDATKLITDIHQQQRIPLLVGGTMLYFYTLKHGLSPLPGKNDHIRQALEEERKAKGLDALHQELQTIDPILAQKIHPHDPQRLLRALEIYRTTNKPPSTSFQQWQTFIEPNQVLELILMPKERSALHQQIAKRFHHMLEQGFIDEVKQLMARGDLDLTLPSMRCVGYRQLWEYLAGQLNYDDAIEKAIIATRQLAKRQITWLRRFTDAHILLNSFDHFEELEQQAERLLLINLLCFRKQKK